MGRCERGVVENWLAMEIRVGIAAEMEGVAGIWNQTETHC